MTDPLLNTREFGVRANGGNLYVNVNGVRYVDQPNFNNAPINKGDVIYINCDTTHYFYTPLSCSVDLTIYNGHNELLDEKATTTMVNQNITYIVK